MTVHARRNKGVQAKNQPLTVFIASTALWRLALIYFKIASSAHTFNNAIELLLILKQGCPESFWQWIQLGKNAALATKPLALQLSYSTQWLACSKHRTLEDKLFSPVFPPPIDTVWPKALKVAVKFFAAFRMLFFSITLTCWRTAMQMYSVPVEKYIKKWNSQNFVVHYCSIGTCVCWFNDL